MAYVEWWGYSVVALLVVVVAAVPTPPVGTALNMDSSLGL